MMAALTTTEALQRAPATFLRLQCTPGLRVTAAAQNTARAKPLTPSLRFPHPRDREACLLHALGLFTRVFSLFQTFPSVPRSWTVHPPWEASLATRPLLLTENIYFPTSSVNVTKPFASWSPSKLSPRVPFFTLLSFLSPPYSSMYFSSVSLSISK